MDASTRPNRRHFLKSSAAAAASLTIAGNAYAQGGDELKVGLIGCGGRGTGAAGQALRADRNVKLWAMADAFDDRLQSSLTAAPGRRRHRRQDRRAGRTPLRRLRRLSAGHRLLRCGAAVHAAALSADPSAGGGAGRQARLRREAVRRRRAGRAFGAAKRARMLAAATCRSFRDSVCATTTASRTPSAASTTGPWAISSPCRPTICAGRSGTRTREPGWTDMQWHMRNWYYYTWLSGDFNVEQHVHYPRRLRLGHGRPLSRSSATAPAAGRCAPRPISATSTIISASFMNSTMASSFTASAGSKRAAPTT